MLTCLINCSNEVVEAIVVLLDLDDIRSLRRTCRTLAIKCSQDKFRSYLRSKHVDVADSALQELVFMTQPGRLGCCVQHLVLVGVVNNTKQLEAMLAEVQEMEEQYSDTQQDPVPNQENLHAVGTKIRQDLRLVTQRQTDYVQLHESGMDVSLLSEAFSNILANSITKKLLSLSLEVVVYRKDAKQRLAPLAGGSWRFIWQAATNTFHTTLRSLSRSSLPIEKLNIFNNRQLQRCSLASNEPSRIDFDHEGLAISLASLKSLSISFSGKVIFESKRDAEQSYDPYDPLDEDNWEEGSDEIRTINEIRSEAADEGNFTGLAKILKLSSQLEELEVHQYQLERGQLALDDLHYERFFSRAAEIDIPKSLKRIELRGSYVREEDLLTFVQQTSVRYLSMINVHLPLGTFRAVFDYCTSEASNIEELYFHKLSERELTVYFNELGENWVPLLLVGVRDIDTLRRVGAEVKQKINYFFIHNFEASSPTMVEYRRQQYIEYRPPDRTGQEV